MAIVVKPAFLGRIELFDPTLKGPDAPPVVSGRDAPLLPGTHFGLDSGFLLPAFPEPRDVYLRVTTGTSLTIDLSVVTADEANRRGQTGTLVFAGYGAMLMCFCLWGLVHWAVQRDALYGLFALRQFCALMHLSVFGGALRFFLSHVLGAEQREAIYAVVSCAVIIAVGYFDMRLISDFGGAAAVRRVVQGMLLVPLACLALIAAGQVQEALHLGSVLANLMILSLVVFAFSARGGHERPYGRFAIVVLRVGFLAMAAVIIVPVLMYQNLLKSSVPLFGILFFHAVISALILFAILSIRSRQRDLMAQEARVMMQVREAELQAESARREEKERFLSMLTHELRNPLSVICLSADADGAASGLVQRAAREMAEVIDRVEQSEKIEGGYLRVEKVAFDAAAEIGRIVASHEAGPRLMMNLARPCPVVTDACLFARMVGNLLDNALKYGAAGATISLTLERGASGRGLSLRLENELGAAGAPDAARVFTKYYRAARARRVPGSGLGLFLVASWAAALGGRVSFGATALSTGRPGVCFCVELP